MANGNWNGCRLASRKLRSSSRRSSVVEKEGQNKTTLSLERKDWENAICSVCMDSPHNAVLLLCSSHDNGCRPYMCDTSYRYSNCLDQFKKAYAKGSESPRSELACPLCRGEVKGWTVVGPARECLNKRKRICVQDDCSFKGTYKKLRKHVKAKHASARPRRVDPVLEHKWKTLEHEREREDVMSIIRSSMPGSMVFGDYVIEMSDSEDYDSSDFFDDDEDDAEFHRFRNNRRDNFGGGSNRRILQAILREGARLARFRREAHPRPMAADVAVALSSEEEVEEDDDGYLRYENSNRILNRIRRQLQRPSFSRR